MCCVDRLNPQPEADINPAANRRRYLRVRPGLHERQEFLSKYYLPLLVRFANTECDDDLRRDFHGRRSCRS
jgi:hypothetical protein